MFSWIWNFIKTVFWTVLLLWGPASILISIVLYIAWNAGPARVGLAAIDFSTALALTVSAIILVAIPVFVIRAPLVKGDLEKGFDDRYYIDLTSIWPWRK